MIYILTAKFFLNNSLHVGEVYKINDDIYLYRSNTDGFTDAFELIKRDMVWFSPTSPQFNEHAKIVGELFDENLLP